MGGIGPEAHGGPRAQVPGLFDAVVLTQGLADHAHAPTLRRIPRMMPIVANPEVGPPPPPPTPGGVRLPNRGMTT